MDFILKSVERKPKVFKVAKVFKRYLFNPDLIKLLSDNRKYLFNRLKEMKVSYDADAATEDLKDLIEASESKIISERIQDTTIALKNYKEYGDIVDVFEKIVNREMPDAPLYLEWNVWRAFVMMNYAKDIRGNFRIDLDGVPLSTAGGNMPDIEIDFGGFKVIVEVTMSSGSRQYEMEGEPVARHFGKVQKSSSEPVYCLFIAPSINENSLAHFFNLNRFNTKAYGGKTQIVPMSLDHFVLFVTIAKDKGFNRPAVLKEFLDAVVKENQSVNDEEIWFNSVAERIPKWVG